MSRFQMSPVLLKSLFRERHDHKSPQACRLERMQLIWGEDGANIKIEPLLTFHRGFISRGDIATEMQLAIEGDLEVLGDEYDRDADLLDAEHKGRLELDDELSLSSPYITDDVDTLYRLTMDDGKAYDLFVMRGALYCSSSEQVEMSVRTALKPLLIKKPEAAFLLSPYKVGGRSIE